MGLEEGERVLGARLLPAPCGGGGGPPAVLLVLATARRVLVHTLCG